MERPAILRSASDQDAFCFGTKAETLERLAARLDSSAFLPQIYFSCRQWRQSAQRCIDRVLGVFPGQPLAVRSSARSEDTHEASGAGAHHSVIGVKAERGELHCAVEDVVRSYGLGKDEDQILIQPALGRVSLAGVVMTRDLGTGANYYVINYDDTTSRTDSVTSGAINKLILVRRGHYDSLSSPRIRSLLKTIVAIEKVTGNEDLDIEFCVDPEQHIYILQVRPLAARRNWQALDSSAFDRTLDQIGTRLSLVDTRDEGYAGRRTILGEMPDWNPAEMIGSAPSPLALSLYKRLITDRTWLEARMALGYRSLPERPLLIDLSGRPYIDVRRSFNSFLPDGLDTNFAERLIDHQLDTLAENPEWHDKVEFNVAVTCRDFGWPARARSLIRAGFDAGEVEEFGARLGRLTSTLITEGSTGLRRTIESMREQREPEASVAPLPRARQMLEACRTAGTFPFAVMARHAFVGISLLRSLVERGAITTERAEIFLQSIDTVATRMVRDLENARQNEHGLSSFLGEYGHLRPGTYDICSDRYDDNPGLYFGGLSRALRPHEMFTPAPAEARDTQTLLREMGFEVEVGFLFEYIAAAIEAREEAKYIFTRHLSNALRELTRWGESAGFSRTDLSFVDIARLIDNAPDLGVVREEVAAARSVHLITRAIKLPTLISSPIDVDVVRLPFGHPTFITRRTVHGKPVILSGQTRQTIDDCVVLIESADPGYDWIFSHPILGLVTKFGGANSHMAIRCAEFGLPAAIGCGERLFAEMASAPAIELNCSAGTLKALGR